MASSFPPHPSATTTATAATPASDTARRVVTVLIARRVAPASVAAFEAAMQGMLAAAESFPGHLGGQVIRPFALVMAFGVFTGTFSSIYIASPLLLAIERRWPGADARGVKTSAPQAGATKALPTA